MELAKVTTKGFYEIDINKPKIMSVSEFLKIY